MNRTDGNTVNASVAPTQLTTYGYYQPIVGLHPGYTTLISLGIAIFIIIVYIYYQDVQNFLKRACSGSETSQTNTVNLAYADNRGDGIQSITVINMNQIQTERLLKEPAIRCECGQVHILKECLNEEELKRYKALFCHFRSDEDTKHNSALEEVAMTARQLTNRADKPLESSDLRVDEGFASNNELPHVVECDFSTVDKANKSQINAGASSSSQNSSANSDASPSSRYKVRSISISTINENVTPPYCGEDTVQTRVQNIQTVDDTRDEN